MDAKFSFCSDNHTTFTRVIISSKFIFIPQYKGYFLLRHTYFLLPAPTRPNLSAPILVWGSRGCILGLGGLALEMSSS